MRGMGPCWKCAQALDQSKLAVRRLGTEGRRSLWVMESGNGAPPVCLWTAGMHLSGRQRHPSAWIALVLETTRAHVTAVTLSRRLKQLLESAAVGTSFFSIVQGRVQVIDSIATRRHHTRQRPYLSLQEWIGGPELATRYGQVCILLVCGVRESVYVCV